MPESFHQNAEHIDHRWDDAPPIDLVYTYVDGDDPVHIEERMFWMKRAGNISPGNDDHKIRFCNVGEIFFSVRSVLKYMPWVRKIFIISNSHKVPIDKELTDSSRVRIIPHKEIIPGEFLPTFNSIAIESFMHRIEGLSEYFLYDNDDIVHFSPVPKSFFIGKGDDGDLHLKLNAGLAVVHRIKRIASFFLPPYPLGLRASQHATAISNLYCLLRSCRQRLSMGRIIVPWHFTHVYRRSTAFRLEEEFSVQLHANRAHKFRVSERFSYSALAYSMELGWHPEDELSWTGISHDPDKFEFFDFAALFAKKERLWKKVESSSAMFACLNNIPQSEMLVFANIMRRKGLGGVCGEVSETGESGG